MIQARNSGAMDVTMAMLKNFVTCMQALPTLLRVLRFYVVNKANASRVGKSGGISCMLRIIKHCGKRHQLVQKLALNALTCMCQPSNQEAFFLGVAGIADLLKVREVSYRIHFFLADNVGEKDTKVLTRLGDANISYYVSVKISRVALIDNKTFSKCDDIWFIEQ